MVWIRRVLGWVIRLLTATRWGRHVPGRWWIVRRLQGLLELRPTPPPVWFPPSLAPYLRPAVTPAPGMVRPVWTRGSWQRVGAWQFRGSGLFRRRLTMVALVWLLIGMVAWPPLYAQAITPTYLRTLTAQNAATNWEVRTAGNDTNGGGFNSGATGTDMAQFDNKNTSGGSNCFSTTTDLSVTDLVTNGTSTVTSATANFSTAIPGNSVYITGGTAGITAAWYQVASRTNSTTIVLDRSTGLTAGTGATINIGGAFLSPAAVFLAVPVANNAIYIKNGSYTVTTASTNVAGGCVSSSLALRIEGYQTTRGDLGTMPVITASGISTFVLFTLSGGRSTITNLALDGASLTSSRGIAVRGTAMRCKFSNFTNSGFIGSTTGHVEDCEATGCSSVAAFTLTLAGSAVNCVAHDNTVTGFNITANGMTLVRCIADTNTGAAVDGFTVAAENFQITNCVAYNNGRDGFRVTDHGLFENTIAESNTGTGFNLNSANCVMSVLRDCAYFGNGTNTAFGSIRNIVEIGSVLGTASFFTNAGAGDFSLNNTAGGGAALRAMGYPGALPFGGTGYLDIGALQHQDAASGGAVSSTIRGGFVN